MPNTFAWDVIVDGRNIAELIPDGSATITYGRQEKSDQPTPTTAVLEIITIDAPDYPRALVGGYPEFTLGDHGIPSGFTLEWLDTYEGGSSRVRLGTPVTIGVGTPSGFRTAWVDHYNDGLNLTRFTGTIVALDYTPERIQVTCAGALGPLTRITTPMAGLPEEAEDVRAKRYWPTITVEGSPAVTVAPTKADAKPMSVFNALEELASNSDALLYAARDGSIIYRTENEPTADITLPPSKTLIESLAMAAELGTVVNHLVIEYGPEDARETFIARDTVSITDYGQREETFSTDLADLFEAEQRAYLLLDRYSTPHWVMPDVEINLGMCNDAEVGRVTALDLGDTVHVPHLLQSSPAASYAAECLGYTETLSATDWLLAIHLAPLSTNAALRSSA